MICLCKYVRGGSNEGNLDFKKT